MMVVIFQKIIQKNTKKNPFVYMKGFLRLVMFSIY